MTSLNRFTRTDGFHKADAASKPAVVQHRLFGEQVAVGEPVRIQGDADLRREIETSLEVLAKQRLIEAEDEANALLAKARSDAAVLLEKANAQARELLTQTNAQVDEIRNVAHEEGFKAGFQEGYADATEQVERETVDLLRGANTLLDGAYQAEKLVLKQFEPQAMSMIRHLLHKILRREVADSPETLMAMVSQAVESLYMSGKVQVVISPLVIHELREYAASISDALGGMERFEFIADPGLDQFQIFIVGQEGCFDLSPLTQAEQVMAAIEPHLQLPSMADVSDAGMPSTEPANPLATQSESLMIDDERLVIPIADAAGDLYAPDVLLALGVAEAEPEEVADVFSAEETDLPVLESPMKAAPFDFPSLDEADDNEDSELLS